MTDVFLQENTITAKQFIWKEKKKKKKKMSRIHLKKLYITIISNYNSLFEIYPISIECLSVFCFYSVQPKPDN